MIVKKARVRGETVCFQTDHSPNVLTEDSLCDWGMEYESIIGWGVPDEIVEAEEKNRILNIITTKYGAGADNVFPEGMVKATTVFKIPLTTLTGKRDG